MEYKCKKLIFAALAVLLISGTAMGYDANTPFTVTMNFIVPSDTTFTATLAGTETTIDFNPATANSIGVQPDSQDNSTSVPIVNITNAGNVNANYSVNLTAAKPSWVTLKANSGTDYATATAFDTTAVELAGWQNIVPSTVAPVYLWADFTSAVGGTTVRTFQINAKQS